MTHRTFAVLVDGEVLHRSFDAEPANREAARRREAGAAAELVYADHEDVDEVPASADFAVAEAYAVGHSAGWSHANVTFETSVPVEEPDPEKMEVPGRFKGRDVEDYRDGYRHGWRDFAEEDAPA